MPPAQAVGRRLSRIAGHTRAQPAAAVVQEPPVPDNSTAHPRRFAADPEAADEQAARDRRIQERLEARAAGRADAENNVYVAKDDIGDERV